MTFPWLLLLPTATGLGLESFTRFAVSKSWRDDGKKLVLIKMNNWPWCANVHFHEWYPSSSFSSFLAEIRRESELITIHWIQRTYRVWSISRWKWSRPSCDPETIHCIQFERSRYAIHIDGSFGPYSFMHWPVPELARNLAQLSPLH